ncbi:hypothetical protein D9M73_83130 [compost metagenome]
MLRVFRQRAKPGQVSRQRQHVGQTLRWQAGKHFRFVKSTHGGLHLRRDLLRAGYFGLVAGGFHGGQHVVQAFRHVQERCAKVALTLRVVVDHHGHAAFSGRCLLQAGQRRGLVGNGIYLRSYRLQYTGFSVARGDEHGIDHAGKLAGGVVISHIGQCQAILALCPLAGVHGQRRHGLQHRHANALKLGFALGRVEHQRRVDDHVGDAARARRGLHMRHRKKQILLLARAIKGIGPQAALLQRRDQRVKPVRVVCSKHRVVDRNCYCFDS